MKADSMLIQIGDGSARTVAALPRPLVLFTCLWFALISQTFASGSVPELFDFVDTRTALTLSSPTVVESRQIVVNGYLLEDAIVISLQMPDGKRYRARRTKVEYRDQYDLTWQGQLEEQTGGRVVLTYENGLLMGLIYAPDGVYQVDFRADAGQVLMMLDQDSFPQCAGVSEPQYLPGQAIRSADTANADSATRIDVMVVYTPQARDAAGSVAAIEATIQAAVDVANTAFEDSNMPARFNLVHTALANHDDSGDLWTDLAWLESDATVAALRNTHAADIVSLINQDGGGYCGLANVMRNPGPAFESGAFQVTTRNCAVGNLSWAHEHGHNMGFEHDPANGTSPANASYIWSFAHFTGGSYRTVMSYSSECSPCTRVAHFSNPSVTHLGTATGVADERDNHRTGNLTGSIVANFRAQLCSGTANLVLENQNITTTEIYEACDSITAGPGFAILSPADVSFRAGQSVVLGSGFSVGTGATFNVEIDPSIYAN